MNTKAIVLSWVEDLNEELILNIVDKYLSIQDEFRICTAILMNHS